MRRLTGRALSHNARIVLQAGLVSVLFVFGVWSTMAFWDSRRDQGPSAALPSLTNNGLSTISSKDGSRPKEDERRKARQPTATIPEVESVFQVLDFTTEEPVHEPGVALFEDETVLAELSVAKSGFSLPIDVNLKASVEIVSAGYLPLVVDVVDLPGSGGDLFLVPEFTVDVRCLAGGTLLPLSEAKVALSTGGTKTLVDTGHDGIARFEGFPVSPSSEALTHGVRAYELDVQASAPGHVPRSVKLPLTVDRDWTGVQLVLDRALELEILVRDHATGDGVPAAAVVYQWDEVSRRRANPTERPIRTGDDGRAKLLVRSGSRRVELIVHHVDYAGAGRIIDVGGARPSTSPDGFPARMEVVLDLERSWETDGLVLDEEGEPVEGVNIDLDPIGRDDFTDWMRVSYLRHFGHVPDHATTDANGTFTARCMPAGEYQVILWHRDYVENPTNTLLVVGDGLSPWTGELVRAHEVYGRVRDEGGAPLARVAVTVMRYEQQEKSRKGYSKVINTDDDGSFRVSGLVPGPYDFLFAKRGFGTDRLEIDPLVTSGPHEIELTTATSSFEGPAVRWPVAFERAGRAIPDGRVEARFVRLSDGREWATRSGKIRAGRLVLSLVPAGLYDVVLAVEDYAPLVLDEVMIGAEDVNPYRAEVPAGAALLLFEILGSVSPGMLRVRDLDRDLVLVEVSVSPIATKSMPPVERRFMAGSYEASFEADNGETFTSAFAVKRFEVEPVRVRLALGGTRTSGSPK